MASQHLGCENCEIGGPVVFRRVSLTTKPGVVDLGPVLSVPGKKPAAHLASIACARVCEGSALSDRVPDASDLLEPGESVQVILGQRGVAKKIGPLLTGAGSVCIVLDPFRQGIDGLEIPNTDLLVVSEQRKAG